MSMIEVTHVSIDNRVSGDAGSELDKCKVDALRSLEGVRQFL